MDARKPGGREAIQRVAASCDMMLANLRPGATQRMGIGADVDPDLIETHVTGYGLTGPYSGRPGIDPLAQALMGLSRAQGGSGNAPSFAAQPGAHRLHRRRHGDARLDPGALFASPGRLRAAGGQQPAQCRRGSELALVRTLEGQAGTAARRFRPARHQRIPPALPAADGWIYVAADTGEARAALAGALGLGALDPAGEGHPAESPLARAMEAAFAGLPLETALARLEEAGVPAAEARGGESELFLEDESAHRNGFVTEADHPTAGRMRIAWNYIRFRDNRAFGARPTPLLGEHSADVLAEAGADAAEIEALFASGAVLAETG